MMNKVWWFVFFYNTGLFILIGWGIWYIQSALPLIALIFSLKYSVTVDKSDHTVQQ